MRAQLPERDLRKLLLEALIKAINARTFDDSALSLEARLQDLDGAEHRPS